MDPEDQLRVFVVDGGPSTIDETSMALRHQGFIAASANTGGAARALRELRPADLDRRAIAAEGQL